MKLYAASRISDFASLQGNPNTRSSYQSAVRRYLDHIYEPIRKGRLVTREEALKYERLAEDYFSKNRNYAVDLQRFAASLNASKSPPKSAQFWLSVIREFLKVNGVTITDDQWKAVKARKPKGRLARTREATFSPELIRKILPYMPVQTKAVFLTMLSSGMRIGETVRLEMDDIFFEEEPARIEIPGHITKSGDPRTVFISREAAAAVRAWLDVREAWLKSSVNRNNGLLKYHGKEHLKKVIEDDNRIFPVHDSTIQESFTRALEKAGVDELDPKTNRRRVHLHMCRKLFRTRMAQKIPVDAVELLLGHNGYLSDAYVRYTVDELRELYLQAEGAVTVGVSDEIAAAIVGEAFLEEKKQLKTLIEEVSRLQEENATLKTDIQKIREAGIIHGNMKAESILHELLSIPGVLEALAKKGNEGTTSPSP